MANFWLSTHCSRWLLTPYVEAVPMPKDMDSDSDAETPEKDTSGPHVPPETASQADDVAYILRAHYVQKILTIGKRARLVHSACATAAVYFHRFHSTQPYDNAMTTVVVALYVAAKVEECPIKARKLVSYVCPEDAEAVATIPDNIRSLEFAFLEALDHSLLVFLPFRPLQQYAHDLNVEELVGDAWCLVNDMLRTSLCLYFPPHVLALAALHLAAVPHGSSLLDWVSAISVDPVDLEHICAAMIRFYAHASSSVWPTRVAKALAHSHQNG